MNAIHNQTSIPEHVKDILRRKEAGTRIVVVGASNNPEKYGNIIVKQLGAQGYAVLPVNPKEPAVEGLKAYESVTAVPGPVDIVDFVTPPAVTVRTLEAMDPKAFPVVWFQDGSWDEACATYADSKFETVVRNACIMVASRTVGI